MSIYDIRRRAEMVLDVQIVPQLVSCVEFAHADPTPTLVDEGEGYEETYQV